MKTIVSFTTMMLFIPIYGPLMSNNIQVNNVSLEGQNYTEQYAFVEFDISWENSWRTSSIPANYDAAWIFVKYRIAEMEWHHMVLRQTDYFAPAGSTLEISADSVGAFIYRDSNGSGSVSWSNIRFRWDYGLDGIANDALLEVRVFAIEMVNILEDAFYVGDDSAYYHFHQGNDVHSPYYITSDGSITVNNVNSSDLWSQDFYIVSGTIPAAYPVGYDAFYCMKYETSQEQYMDFLNTLTRTQQDARTETTISVGYIDNIYVLSDSMFMINRNGIRCESDVGTGAPITFYCDYNGFGSFNEPDDGQNIAGNFLNWMDAASYLDWSGLRPMTELEYEKVSRGPNYPVKGEFPWGTSTIKIGDYTVINQGSGNELISNMAVSIGNAFHYQANQGIDSDDEGPVRCGIFAASATNHTRVETGAGYYGVMELGGNLGELVVNINDVAGRSFTGLHGDGETDISGNANVDHWPGINGNYDNTTPNGVYGGTTGVTEYAGAGGRGGAFNWTTNYCMTSDRGEISGSVLSIRYSSVGFRGCRSAP